MSLIQLEQDYVIPVFNSATFENYIKSINLPYRVNGLDYTKSHLLLFVKFTIILTGSSPSAIKSVFAAISEWK